MTDTTPSNAAPTSEVRLTELEIGDDPLAWERAGFVVVDGVAQVGHVRLRFVGPGAEVTRGIRSWSFAADLPADLDGVTTWAAPEPGDPAPDHPNGVNHFDHVVLMSPDSDRTTEILAAAGFEARGVREFDRKGTVMRQTFFWMGEVILELVGPAHPDPGGAPASSASAASLWGLAFTTPDLDATVSTLGDLCSEARTAVQPGRRIASLRHKELDVTVPVAFMTPHVNVSSGSDVEGV